MSYVKRKFRPVALYIPWSATTIAFLFLYAPIAVMVAMSFNDNRSVGLPFTAFTLHWYSDLFSRDDMLASMLDSVIVGLGAAAIATPLGLLAAIGLDRYDFPGKEAFRSLVMMPLVLPGVVTGVAVLNLVVLAQIPLSLFTVVIGQGTALMCIVTGEIFGRLQQLGRSQTEAASNLGASAWEVFWRITIPSIRTALFAAALMTFSLAADDLSITFFLTGRQNTLSMVLWSMLRSQGSPIVNAAGTVMIVLTLALFSTALTLSQRERTRRGRQHT
jgi:spermidine/putrescine transport system permease protein